MNLPIEYVQRLIRYERIAFFLIGFSTAAILMTILIVIAEHQAKGGQS